MSVMPTHAILCLTFMGVKELKRGERSTNKLPSNIKVPSMFNFTLSFFQSLCCYNAVTNQLTSTCQWYSNTRNFKTSLLSIVGKYGQYSKGFPSLALLLKYQDSILCWQHCHKQQLKLFHQYLRNFNSSVCFRKSACF